MSNSHNPDPNPNNDPGRSPLMLIIMAVIIVLGILSFFFLKGRGGGGGGNTNQATPAGHSLVQPPRTPSKFRRGSVAPLDGSSPASLTRAS